MFIALINLFEICPVESSEACLISGVFSVAQETQKFYCHEDGRCSFRPCLRVTRSGIICKKISCVLVIRHVILLNFWLVKVRKESSSSECSPLGLCVKS